MYPDSLRKNESALDIENEHLTIEDWQPEIFLPPLTCDEILTEGRIFSPEAMVKGLERAYYCLTHVPGPHLETRKTFADGWINWWIEEFRSYSPTGYPFVINHNIHSFDKLSGLITRTPWEIILASGNRMPYIWDIAGLEGHEGSREAVDEVLAKDLIQPILVFEQDNFFMHKVRKKPYLPLVLRLSMWSTYIARRGNHALLTVNPYVMNDKENFDVIYEDLSRELGVFGSIANDETDTGLLSSRIVRSLLFSHDFNIYQLDTPSTTERVRV